jgi:predicted negative regulator of RcsB-dependent stress response
VDNLSTEDEQLAALKRWWSDNGNSLLIGIGAALAIVFGWKAYQNSVIQEKTAASMKYQELVTVATRNDFDSEEGETVSFLADQLKEEFEGSEYSLYAALFLAKEFVEDKNFEGASEQLNWVLANTEDSRLKHIVNARLARVLSAQDKHTDALALLTPTEESFKASYLEISGDIKQRQGDTEGAIEAYKSAFALVKATPQAQPLLAVKLSDLGIDPQTL